VFTNNPKTGSGSFRDKEGETIIGNVTNFTKQKSAFYTKKHN